MNALQVRFNSSGAGAYAGTYDARGEKFTPGARYTVKFDKNGGTGNTPNKTVDGGEKGGKAGRPQENGLCFRRVV